MEFGRVLAALLTVLGSFHIVFKSTDVCADERRRIAVVVGIGQYQDPLSNLPNAIVDAGRIADQLRERHGFLAQDIHLLTEPRGVSREDIENKWIQIVSGLKSGDTVVFYYAGHAIELKGRNYLMTSNVVMREGTTDTGVITGTSVDFQSMLERLGGRQDEYPGIVGIFILDACRENIFVYDWQRTDTRGVGLGASAMPPQELFIIYSAGIGQKALDGGAGGHSPFVKALLAQLAKADVALGDLAQQVRTAVIRDAFENYDGHLQTPAFYDQLHHRRTIGGQREPQRFTLDNRPFNFNWRYEHGDALIECPSCPEMIVLGGGSYVRGSPDGSDGLPIEAGRNDDEGPRRQVTLKGFAIGKFEVTNWQWDQCVGEPLEGIRCPGGLRATRPDEGGKPVTGISWQDANTYARWLSAKTGGRYRLPTESEWEYAARAGTTTPYSFDARSDRKAICTFANGADREMGILPHTYRHCSDGTGRHIAHVGRYRENPWGLHDVHGNVWEWTQDCWHPSYEGAATDGTARGASSGRCDMRVARGGSWRSTERALRSAVRNAFPPDHRRATVGFRVVRETS
jgi:formylglycine-generating enzyme required for sulfatase activity